MTCLNCNQPLSIGEHWSWPDAAWRCVAADGTLPELDG
jgi:hypothetical protein